MTNLFPSNANYFFLTIASVLSLMLVTATSTSLNSCQDCQSVIGKLNIRDENMFRTNVISVSLEGANRTAFLNDQKMFVFHNIPVGAYIVNVNDYLYQYEQVLVEVTPVGVKAYQYNLKNGKGLKHKTPFEINPLFKIKYEEDAPNVIESIIKSPYAIIIGITVLLFACMQMMPQDQLKESFEQMNKQMNQYNTAFKQ